MSPAELISVIIPTRNRRRRLLEAIDSVRRQQGVELEIVVVDDASSDETNEAMLELLKREPRLRYFRNSNPMGGGGARNVGLREARGGYITFLDDDDCYLPGKLEKQWAVLSEHREASAVSCHFVIRFADKRTEVKRLRPPANRQELLRTNTLGGASVCMVRAEIARGIGGFDATLRSCQDWDFWLKLDAVGPIRICDDALVEYVFHGEGQITGNRGAEYQGKRKTYLRYRREMNVSTRRHGLCELEFYRRVLFAPSVARSIRGMLRVLLLAQGGQRLRYLWRAFKFWYR